MARKLPETIATVPCTLEGYEGITVSYNVGVPFSSIEATGNDTTAALKLLGVRVHGWDFEDALGNPIPAPSGDTGLEGISAVFLVWLVNEGFKKAVESVAQRPNSLNGSKPISLPAAQAEKRRARQNS